MRTVATLALLFVGASLSLAQNPVGTWKGKMNIKFPAPPANAPPERKAQFETAKAQLAKAVILLTVKGNKTWNITTKGMPMPAGDAKGTWSQSGNTLTLKTDPNPQNPGRTAPPQAAKFSKDGKVLTISLPNNMGSVVFKK